MTEDLKKYEQTIEKKHRFHWTPKFEEEIRTDLGKAVFIAIAIKTFEKLEWDAVHQDETSAEAKRKGNWNRWTEKISVTYEYGKVIIKSVSLGNEMWDNGRNSKRVRLFIHAFRQTENEFDQEALVALEKEVEKSNNWDGYEIPESLPQPQKRKEPQFWIPVVGGVITAFLLGFIVAWLSIRSIYMIGLFEVGVALAIGFVLKYLIRLTNYTNYDNLNYLLVGMIVIIYVSNQYFQYQIVLNENNYEPIGFLEFMKLRFEAGLTIKSLNTGWIGLVISWVFQLGITYAVGTLRLVSSLIAYQLQRVPMEVVDFAFYHFVKEKTEGQVRKELSTMGWKSKQAQDEVFESIGAVYGAAEFNRME